MARRLALATPPHASCPTASLHHPASEARPVAAILLREINFNLTAERKS